MTEVTPEQGVSVCEFPEQVSGEIVIVFNYLSVQEVDFLVVCSQDESKMFIAAVQIFMKAM